MSEHHKKLKVGVSGNRGSFSELAAQTYLETLFIPTSDTLSVASLSAKADNPEIHYLIDMESVLRELNQDKIDLGLLPIINNNAGVVQDALEAMGQYQFELQDSFPLAIAHCLMTLPGVAASDITHIASHPQALKQCQQYLAEYYPQAEIVEWVDTAEAARSLTVGELPNTAAAIAPITAASLYQLNVLAENIQDNKVNETTFIVVSSSSALSSSSAKAEDPVPNINTLRQTIDNIDKDIIKLLAERNNISKNIGYYKQQHKLAIGNPEREQTLLNSHQALAAQNNLSHDFINALFKLILTESKRVQADVS